MMDIREARHNFYLDNLITRLPSVGERVKSIRSIIKEPMWFESGNQHELCDLIILYRDFSATAVELKGSIRRREKARHQIDAGRIFIEDVLKYDFRYGLFVVYRNRRYMWERL